MSSAILKQPFISVEDYLAGELVSDVKHEYENGEVYAMAGAKLNHERITTNLLRKLADHLENTSCEVVSKDFKVNINFSKFYYPDLMVFCESLNGEDVYTEKPILIIEVLSKSTRRKDHTTKRFAYRQIDTLQEYVLIEQDNVHIEVSRRSESWDSAHYFLGDEVCFQSLDLKIPVSEVYRRVDNQDMREFLQATENDNADA